MQLAEIWWPLLLSTFAGLSTSIGAVIAIIKTPDEAMLAFLLGTAVGVMGTVSCIELWWHKATQHNNWAGITAAVAAGAVVFALLDPLLPKAAEHELLSDHNDHEYVEDEPTPAAEAQPHAVLCLGPEPHMRLSSGAKADKPGTVQLLLTSRESSANSSPRHTTALQPTGLHGSSSNLCGANAGQQDNVKPHKYDGIPVVQVPAARSDLQRKLVHVGSSSLATRRATDRQGVRSTGAAGCNTGGELQDLRAHHSGLMRLGLLMAVTMTIHNLPEGFAVAFSAFTGFGKLMAVAIAVHNIPEGLVIAVPIYAATNSKVKAIGLAAASGLSEPLGALVALFIFKPFVDTVQQLDYVLAFVGGVMLAVCGLELWPEGRKCRQDVRFAQGIVLGALVMGWTLSIGV